MITIRSRRTPLVILILFVFLSLHYWHSSTTTERVEEEVEVQDDDFDPFEQLFRQTKTKPASPYHHHRPKPKKPPTPPPPSPWSSLSEYYVGNWLPREPQYTSWEDFKLVNAHKGGWIWPGCRIFNDTLIPDSPEKDSLRRSRLIDLMNWTWHPTRGSLIPFDPIDFVVRLLQSPGGLIMFGDSITRQHHDSLIVFLAKEEVYHDHVVENYTTRYYLRRNAPKFGLIRDLAGVGEERLGKPFVTIVEDHMILPEEDIRKIADAPKEWVWPIRHHPHVEDLMGILRDATKPVEGEGAKGVDKDSILLFSTGPHWSRSRLPIPQTGYKEERATMLDIYNKMIQIVTTRFTTLPRTTIIYRSSASPHPQCETHIKPYESYSVALAADEKMLQLHTANPEPQDIPKELQGVGFGLGLDLREGKGTLALGIMGETERRNHARWDWDLWRVYNSLWEGKIGELMREREVKAEGGKGAKWVYLDISQMSMQRPDAHAEPGSDCLHYCTPSIYEVWTDMLFHRLFLLGEVPEPKQPTHVSGLGEKGEKV